VRERRELRAFGFNAGKEDFVPVPACAMCVSDPVFPCFDLTLCARDDLFSCHRGEERPDPLLAIADVSSFIGPVVIAILGAAQVAHLPEFTAELSFPVRAGLFEAMNDEKHGFQSAAGSDATPVVGNHWDVHSQFEAISFEAAFTHHRMAHFVVRPARGVAVKVPWHAVVLPDKSACEFAGPKFVYMIYRVNRRDPAECACKTSLFSRSSPPPLRSMI
jgi:hypothetical protein